MLETNNIDTIYFSYDIDRSLISMNLTGPEYFYIKNLQGDITKIIDSYKNVLVEYRYDAWGNVETIYDETFFSLSSINIYYYRGYRYDIETSLYYCNFRYYVPEWGRFLQDVDVSVLNPNSFNGLNSYAYAINNPVSVVVYSSNAGSGNSGNFVGICQNWFSYWRTSWIYRWRSCGYCCWISDRLGNRRNKGVDFLNEK